MAQFVNMFEVDLQKPNHPQPLRAIVGEGDSNGLRVGAYVTDGGTAVSLGGSCVGKVVRADGATVQLTGTISGNQAYVVLDQQACAIEGPIQVAVCWVNSANVTTLVLAYGTVVNTQTGTAIQPSTPIPDLTQLLAQISAMETATAAANAAASSALTNFAGAFSASTAYTAGQYVTYTDGKFYRFTTNHAAGAWNSAHVVAVTAGGELADLKSALDYFSETGDAIFFDQTVSGTNMASIHAYFPAGTYRLKVASVSSTDSQYTTSRISFYGDNGLIMSKDVDRVRGNDDYITLSANAREIDFYGAHSYGDGSGVVFSFNDVEISASTTVGERLTTAETDIGQIKSSINGNQMFELLNRAVNTTTFIDIPVNFPAGTYVLEASSFVSSDTDQSVCRMVLRYNGSDKITFDNDRNVAIHRIITSTSAIDTVRIYAGTTYSNSLNDTLTISSLKFYLQTGLSERLDSLETSANKVNAFQAISNIFRFNKFYSHLGVDKTDDIIIPCQSLADVARTKRLGFDVLEINVRQTADNKYVCLHGASGAFGWQFKNTDGEYVESVMVNSLTLQEIKNTIRFRSNYTKYQTAPFTIEEMLTECKKLNIIPLVEYQSAYTDLLDICNEIMGRNNYLIGSYSYDRPSINTDAPMSSWLSYNTVSNIIAKCNQSGGLYIAGLNVTNGDWQNYTDTQWKAYVDAIHENGYQCGFVSGYANEAMTQRLLNIGFDVAGSEWRINEIENGNLCNLYAGTDFVSGFNTNGTVSNGVLTLANGQTITPKATLNNVFLGGGSLHIAFSGSLRIQFGDNIDAVFTGSDTSDHWFSTFFEESAPTFTITATASTTVYDISYKASAL